MRRSPGAVAAILRRARFLVPRRAPGVGLRPRWTADQIARNLRCSKFGPVTPEEVRRIVREQRPEWADARGE